MSVSYLRVVVTPRCSLACDYCHLEGDPATASARSLDTGLLTDLLMAGLDNGVRKLKFLGGEPLLRRDLPRVVESLRDEDPDLDLSVITGGAVPAGRLDALFAAGISRANLSVHGFSLHAFAARTGRGAGAWRVRNRTLERLLEHGRPAKLNYVYTGPQDLPDLDALLQVASDWPVVVNVLDDLGNPGLGHRDIVAAVLQLRGTPARERREDDPHRLTTLRLHWNDGLEVEVKDQQLGRLAPWMACASCPARTRCREGIHALRLSHEGVLRPCMDRPELGLDLRPLHTRGGRLAVSAAWACFTAGTHRRAA